MLKCKNGIVDSGELCDNTFPGCGDNCLPEKGYECFPKNNTCITKCGNGIVDAGESCDNIDDEGCSPHCEPETGY